MLKCLALAALMILPHDDVNREAVDLIELNHFYNEHGKLVFDQVIFYDWSADDTRFHVRDWLLVKTVNHVPVRDFCHDCYTVMWQDGEQLRRIESKSFRETWTQYDPELVEREYLPKERRRELRTVKYTRKER